MSNPPQDQKAHGVIAKVTREIRERPFGYAVMAAFTIAGPFVTAFLFPDAPAALGLFGGLVFGAYAALCAVPGQFM